MLASLGDAYSAWNMARLLQRDGINARFIVLSGWRADGAKPLDDVIRTKFADLKLDEELPIVTGYAHCKEGLMGSFDRGYSEMTFSRIAVVTGAKEAIIHKEFHLSSADPRLVGADKAVPIGRTNYDVADQLANMGMEAIHPRAAKGLRQAGIPLRVKNTFEPRDEGTLILDDMGTAPARIDIVTGLRSIFALQFFEQDMVGVKGYDATILEALKRHKVRIVTKSSNANTITLFLEGAMKAVRRVEQDLAESFPSAVIEIRKVALVSVIGRDFALPGLAGRPLAG